MLIKQKSTATTLPQITEMTIYGSGGGMLPLQVSVRVNIDGSGWYNATNYTVNSIVDHYDHAKATTFKCIATHTSDFSNRPGDGSGWKSKWALHSDSDSGFWPEGRWFFKFTKSDGSKLDQPDREKMKVIDPISNQEIFTDEIYSAAPCASYVFYSSGTYKVWARYQNSRKVWSNWLESAPITVAPNTRTKRYVNGNTGSDANDGTSPASAKATLNGALSLVNSHNFEIEIKDDTSCYATSKIALDSYSGIYIHRSNDGINKPQVVPSGGIADVGTNTIIDGINFNDTTPGLTLFSYLGYQKINIAFLNCDFDEVESFCEINNGSIPTGLLFFKINQTGRATRYPIYLGEHDCLNILGCRFIGGSTNEHSIRIGGGKYNSISYSIIDYAGNDVQTKSALRAYTRHIGIYRCILASGTVSLGNIDLKESVLDLYGDYCVDESKFAFTSETASYTALIFWEDTHRIVVRSSLFDKVGPFTHGCFGLNKRSFGGAGYSSGVQVLNCSMFKSGVAQYGIFGVSDNFNYHDLLVRGNIFRHDMTAFTWGIRMNCGSGTSITNLLFKDNIHSEYLGTGREFGVSGIEYLTIDDAMNNHWANNLIEENHLFSESGQPLGTGIQWKTLSTSSVGVFRSLNEKNWTSDGPAGCWRE